MRVSLRWLADYIDLPSDDPGEIHRVLDSLGLKVESVTELKPTWTGVKVARVTKVEPHPNADKVRVCQVDAGEGEIEVVCGAWNFDSGATVAYAVPGAVLTGGIEIGRRNIRGVESAGMICSERELGLGTDHAGIMILDDSDPIGAPVEEVLEYPDHVFDLEITSNRPDQMSMIGVARELAAFYEIPYRMPATEVETTDQAIRTTVRIEDSDGCYRFVARELFGAKVRPSPTKIRQRLRAGGVRPISNIVDVTNYVMLELGQPLHAFDFDRLGGESIVVRRARAGETLTTLDGELRTLSEADLVVADAEVASGLAGTMGGGDSEVSEATTNIVIEAASWDPPTILHMSRRHGIRTEASARFERGVDPNLPPIAAARANRLMMELAGGTSPFAAIDVVARSFSPMTVPLSMSEVTRILGPVVPERQVGRLLTRFGLAVEGNDPLQVTVPTYRRDLERPADLVEEIARLYGFDGFPETLPTGPAGALSSEQHRQRRLRAILEGAGVFQAISLSFMTASDVDLLGYPGDHPARATIRVTNPLNEELETLRSTLLPGLLRALRYNRSRGSNDVALFELGRVFHARPASIDLRLPDQPERLGFALIGSLLGRPVDALTSVAIWKLLVNRLGLVGASLDQQSVPGLHPGRGALVRVDGVEIGSLGELHPRAAEQFELDGRVAVGEIALEPLLAQSQRWTLREPSAFPQVDFDLAFLVPASLPAGALIDATAAVEPGWLEQADLFDEFHGLGDGQKSLAIRYRFRAPDRTLTPTEIADLRARLVSAAGALGAELRGGTG